MGSWLANSENQVLTGSNALELVPPHWRQRWVLRFNQSPAQAAAVSTGSGLPVAAHSLKR